MVAGGSPPRFTVPQPHVQLDWWRLSAAGPKCPRGAGGARWWRCHTAGHRVESAQFSTHPRCQGGCRARPGVFDARPDEFALGHDSATHLPWRWACGRVFGRVRSIWSWRSTPRIRPVGPSAWPANFNAKASESAAACWARHADQHTSR